MKQRTYSGGGIGIASLFMVFSVLCLTTLAVLSYISASGSLKQTDRSITLTTDYYSAVGEAQEWLAAQNNMVRQTEPDSYIYTSINVNDVQSLDVSAYYSDEINGYRLYECKLVYTGEWDTGGSFELWSPNK